jgi:hypothetical protein
METTAFKFAGLLGSDGKELSYPGYERKPILEGEGITFAPPAEDIFAIVGFAYDKTGGIWPTNYSCSLGAGDTITVIKPYSMKIYMEK